jgi:hypothetical protein
LTNSQLGDEQAARLKAKQQTPVKVLEGQLQSARISPGEEAFGVVALETSPHKEPTILRLQFPGPKPPEGISDPQPQQIAAYLVR